MDKVRIFLVSFTVFLIVDLIWLGFIAQPIYDHFIGDFLADSPKWLGAIAFYILFIIGLNYFALFPALKENDQNIALQRGAAYGFFTYMTYELTNYAVIKDWPLGIVPIDIAWGTILALLVSLISFKILTKREHNSSK